MSSPGFAFLLVSTKNTDSGLRLTSNLCAVVVKVYFCNRSQPLLFQISERAKTSRKSVLCGFPALEVARVRVRGADQKKRGLWERD